MRGCGMHEPGKVQKEALRMALGVLRALGGLCGCMASCPVIWVR
jgi:hypothetical protein